MEEAGIKVNEDYINNLRLANNCQLVYAKRVSARPMNVVMSESTNELYLTYLRSEDEGEKIDEQLHTGP